MPQRTIGDFHRLLGEQIDMADQLRTELNRVAAELQKVCVENEELKKKLEKAQPDKVTVERKAKEERKPDGKAVSH